MPGVLGTILGGVIREGAESAAGSILRYRAGQVAGSRTAAFLASEGGQKAAARIIGEKGAKFLATPGGQKLTSRVAAHETRKTLKTEQEQAKPTTAETTAANQRTQRQRQQSAAGAGLRPMGGKSWWQSDAITAPQQAGYNWRTLDDTSVAKGPARRSAMFQSALQGVQAAKKGLAGVEPDVDVEGIAKDVAAQEPLRPIGSYAPAPAKPEGLRPITSYGKPETLAPSMQPQGLQSMPALAGSRGTPELRPLGRSQSEFQTGTTTPTQTLQPLSTSPTMTPSVGAPTVGPARTDKKKIVRIGYGKPPEVVNG